MALFRSPTVAWLGDLFDSRERSKANGVINLMSGVGGLLAYFVGGLLFNSLGRSAPFIAGSIAMVVAIIVALIYVKEPPRIEQAKPEVKTSFVQNIRGVIQNPDRSGLYVLIGILFWFMAFNALETGLSSFAVFSLGIEPGTASIYAAMVTISFIAFSVPSGLIAERIGRKRTIQIGLTGLTTLFLAGYFVIQNVATFLALLFVIGLFWALVNVNSLPLVYDNGDERKIGAYTGMYYFSSQLAAVLGPTLGGVMVDILGDQYRWLFIFGTVFMGLACIVMTQVKERRPVVGLAAVK